MFGGCGLKLTMLFDTGGMSRNGLRWASSRTLKTFTRTTRLLQVYKYITQYVFKDPKNPPEL